ncbi:MAG: beta-ketoacyl-[acyl-carrier-protein] synthase family protein [Verrucomicrobia bacterium]|jgi:3-oxoacyl-[acyl-carrier-protein] synthase-1|nr:beta-ketoacyl-[acyl-carrier-protein] synthase family protein [Verrucomicrobiota bacterium]
MNREGVVITGLGVVSPLGHTTEAIISALHTQQHNFHYLREFAEFKRSRIQIGTSVPDFSTDSSSPEDWTCPYPTPISKEIIRGLNPHSYYAYHATVQALEAADLRQEIFDENTGLFTASAGSPRNLHRNLREMYTYGVDRTNPFGIINSVVGTLSFNLGAIFKIRGAGCGFSSACASSAHALGFAYDQIAMGRQERMIVVGAEDGDLDAILPFAGMHALSTSKDPDAASLPFDRRRKGFVGSGGAAVLILESTECARRRGAPIQAEFLGWGHGSDGHKPAAPHPEGYGLVQALRNALKESEVDPPKIAYLNAHATGTPTGDFAEARALRAVFGSEPSFPISSTKALTGHSLSMAGSLEVALSIHALRSGFIPGTANLLEPDTDFAGLHLPKENLPSGGGIFLSNSCGFGGANVCLAFRAVSNSEANE